MRQVHRLLWCFVLFGLLVVSARLMASGSEQLPFKRTEKRARCSNFSVVRQPFFGELHLHTQYSVDAATLDTRNTPADAYRFAKGEKVGLPPFVNTLIGDEPPASPAGPVSRHPYCLPGERCEFTATRTIQLPDGRALDFAAITDHSEQLGETNICLWEEKVPCSDAVACTTAGQQCFQGRCVPQGYQSPSCVLAREEVAKLRGGLGATIFAGAYFVAQNPTRLPFCGVNGENCVFQAKNVWQQIIADAQDAYDQTDECKFTSFIGYEYTAMPAAGTCDNDGKACWDGVGVARPSIDCTNNQTCLSGSGGDNLHRNIIFRNSNVLPRPISNIEAPVKCGNGPDCKTPGPLGSPEIMLKKLKEECSAIAGCDVLSIPHNPNMSGGAMFGMPENLEEAKLRSEMEPLVELFQIKGQSECRFSSRMPGAWNTFDELCDFENMSYGRLASKYIAEPNAINIQPSSYVRNVLKDGIAYEQKNGINPFKLGVVGALDNHNGTPGASESYMYAKAGAHGDQSFAVSGQALAETNFLGLETNPGGMTVAWAEENSRDSIFEAFKRRETYATSGTRPLVRFFGGFDLPKTLCQSSDFAAQGYQTAVPMGGCLAGSPRAGENCKTNLLKKKGPIFAVLASKDPGWENNPGTPLQRIQIIKGWVDSEGQTHEQVFDVAGDPKSPGTVDLNSCKPAQNEGHRTLCSVWEDPQFKAEQRAFYYARVVENESCRWNQYYCNARGVNCAKPAIPERDNNRYTDFEYQQCCSGIVPNTVQQRAVTSPIWYAP